MCENLLIKYSSPSTHQHQPTHHIHSHSLTHSLTQQTHSSTHAHSLTHRPTHSLSHSPTRSRTHPPVCARTAHRRRCRPLRGMLAPASRSRWTCSRCLHANTHIKRIFVFEFNVKCRASKGVRCGTAAKFNRLTYSSLRSHS